MLLVDKAQRGERLVNKTLANCVRIARDVSSAPLFARLYEALRDMFTFHTFSFIDYACEDPRVDYDKIVYMHRSGITATFIAIENLAANGRLDVIRYLFDNRSEGTSQEGWDRAIGNGHLDVAEYLASKGFTGTPKSFVLAAGNGKLPMVKYLHTKGLHAATKKAIDYAAGGGHLDVVVFLHNERTEGCTNVALESAARKGHIEVCQFLLANRTEGVPLTAALGAIRRQTSRRYHVCTDIVRLLYRKHLDTPETTDNSNKIIGQLMLRSVDMSNLEVLKLLDAPVNNTLFSRAIMNGWVEGLEYLWQRYPDMPPDTDDLCMAIKAGHIELVKILYDRYNLHFEVPAYIIGQLKASSHQSTYQYILARMSTLDTTLHSTMDQMDELDASSRYAGYYYD
eukprot:gene13084-15390_t